MILKMASRMLAGSYGHGLFKSPDGGEPGTVYLGIEPAELFRSRDSGETWVAGLFDSQRRARLRTPFESVGIHYRVQQVFCKGVALLIRRTEVSITDAVGARL
jgi:hypothetical protein